MAPTSIVACGPRRISAAMSTTYDTDMLEPLAIGNWTLNAEVSDESAIRKTSGSSGVNVARGSSVKKISAPNAITARMYQRARAGRSRSTTRQVYFAHNAEEARIDALADLDVFARCRLHRCRV